MATIDFSKVPQNRFYSYLPDGHIYNIGMSLPAVIADGGGYFNCFFRVNPYYKLNENEFYPLCRIESGKSTTLLTTDFHVDGIQYGYVNSAGGYTQITQPEKYYDKDGVSCYKFPDSASNLPQVKYNEETFYFDALIKNGDTYDIQNHKFETMDIEEGEGKTTYGQTLLSTIKEKISINNFENQIANLPKYLTGDNLAEKYEIPSIGYIISPNYFTLFGELYIEKLSDYMILQGQAAITSALSSKTKTAYKKIDFQKQINTEENLNGIIALLPS